MKMFVYIKDGNAFLKGDYSFSLSISDLDSLSGSGWFLAGEVDIEIDVDRQTVVNSVLATLEETEQKERAEHQVKMDLLEKRKQELLSIEYKP